MRRITSAPVLALLVLAFSTLTEAQGLPFKQKLDVYRDKDGEVMVFALRLEQPFLAEEFETSNYLRLQPLDKNAHLVYPKEAKFHQKHAAFYGRLRGEGEAKLRLSYEIVTENLDGSRRVAVRHSEVVAALPTRETGHVDVYREWARQQNAHFRKLLTHYPRETFFKYCLLQSEGRYGVAAPSPGTAPRRAPDAGRDLEADLYRVFTGSLAIQEALQQRSYTTEETHGDHTIHISQLAGPKLRSLPYKSLLENAAKKGLTPEVHPVSALVPEDQYLLQFNSMDAATELADLTQEWGDSILRPFTIHARHSRIQRKIEDQLCLRRDPISRLFADQTIEEVAVTGSDVFLFEGSDLALIFRLKRPEVFEVAAASWVSEVRKTYPALVEREFNYHGHKIAARYTEDRMVSSFFTRHQEYAVFANSHVTIRKIVDTIAGKEPRLRDAHDYQYVCTLLPPPKRPETGYFYASDAFLRRQVGPAMKISEKRRLQCFNSLVMLNNASLFHRLEHGRSPGSLTDLVKGRFIDSTKLVCPHGGAYAFDSQHDTATCSLHNRIKYLTPNAELKVLKVSRQERDGYQRYKERYEGFWQEVFDPIAIRFTATAARVKVETCVLPFANGDIYGALEQWVADRPQPLSAARSPRSAVVSGGATLGQKNIAEYLKQVPGITDALSSDPTLTDLSWLGDRVSLDLCDEDAILEFDPARLRPLRMLHGVPVPVQAAAGMAIVATSLPACVSIEVTNEEKARRFLNQLSSRIFLKGSDLMGMDTTFDAYRLPDYKEHAVYVLSYQLYALKIRLHAALVGGRLVAATRSEVLFESIDAAEAKAPEAREPAHLFLRITPRALDQLKDDVQLYWAEKSRLACHSNIMSIYNLIKLHRVPMEEIDRLSEAKYGVTYYCPEGGAYQFDMERDQVECGVHGNRRSSRQNRGLDQGSSFARFFDSLTQVVASLRYQENSLTATVEIERETRGGGE